MPEIVRTVDRIAAALSMLIEPDDVAELRALHVERGYGRPATFAGFFDGRHLKKMAEAALELTERARGVYFVMNPLRPEILARCCNRVQVAENGSLAGDQHVRRRRWMLLDIDPMRIAGVGSTAAEKAAARDVVDAVRQFLGGRGWPAPILADSGNGWHLFYRIDLPADDGGIVKRCLAALAERFDTAAAEIDRSVFNPARIVKVPGTLARKGDATPDRPHRRGGIIEQPAELVPVPVELLNALAAEAAPTTSPSAPKRDGEGQVERNGNAGGKHRLDVPRWLTDRGRAFRVKETPDATGRTVFVLAACPFDPSHTAQDAAIFQDADGKLAFKCFHNSCADRGWQDAKETIGSPDPNHYDPPLPPKKGGAGESRAATLTRLALERVELFHHGDTPYATERGTARTWPIASPAFAQLLRGWAYAAGLIPGPEAVRTAVDTLIGRARFDGPERVVRTRVAELGGEVYLDLGRDDWSAVRITPDGWGVVTTYPVRFRHPRGMLPLPLPERGGDLAALRELLNVGSEDDWRLLVAWLLSTFRASGPYPVLILTGEMGAAKSTTAEVLRSIIDPNVTLLRSEPRNGRDVVIAATNSWVLALDNLSYMPPWLSDYLCRLATGGGFATRQLYTDGEEWVCDVQRSVILTGIENVVTRGDLLDRAVIIRLPAIPDAKRRTEAEFWAGVDAALPQILGALLDVVAAGLKNLPNTHLMRLPRMADFATWVSACEPALGWRAGVFLDTYAGNVADANELALDSSPLWQPLLAVVDSHGGIWEGTADALLKSLKIAATSGFSDTPLPKGWPAKPNALSGQLRRLAPNARRAGLNIEFEARYQGKRREKIIRLSRQPENAAETADESDGPDGAAENTPNLPCGASDGHGTPPGKSGPPTDSAAPPSDHRPMPHLPEDLAKHAPRPIRYDSSDRSATPQGDRERAERMRRQLLANLRKKRGEG